MPETTTSVAARVDNRDCFDAYRDLPESSIDAVITDPPYFLEGLGGDWADAIDRPTTKSAAVTSLAAGMRFDSVQGREFQEFMQRVATESLRVLKPGGFFIAMSAPRLYHRLAVGVEDAGFEIRDMWTWLYTQNQVKAMSVARFLDRYDLDPAVRAQVEHQLRAWKTPQVKSCIEPMVFAQKPKTDSEGRPVTFLENWLTHGVGLVNIPTGVGSEGDMVTANVLTTEAIAEDIDRAFLVPKPRKTEKGDTSHLSVKPLSLMDQLVRVTVRPGGVVLDPFNGSGSTGVSAISIGRHYRGFEQEPTYFAQSQERFAGAFPEGDWQEGSAPAPWWQVSVSAPDVDTIPARAAVTVPQDSLF